MVFGLFGAGDPPCPAGSICSGQARTKVGGTVKDVQEVIPGTQGSTKTVKKLVGGTDIYHATVTSVTQGADGKVNGGKTEIYVISDNEWKLAATTTDGGQNYEYTDVAGAGLRKDLNNKASAISKNTQAGTSKALDKAGITVPEQKKTIVDSLSNTAPAPPATNTTNTPPKKKEGLSTITEKSIGNEKEGTRNKFPGGKSSPPLSYPESLRDSKQDKIQFNLIEYQPSSFDSDTFGVSNTRNTSETVIGRVFLPIPSGISDTTGAGWGDDKLSPLQIALADLALRGIEQGAEGFVNSLGESIDKIGNFGDDVKKAISTSIAGSAAGVGAGLLTRTTGAVINPNLELLFQGPTLRPFDFRFKLSARNQNESNQIIQIIRFFKQGMAPIRTDSNLFLKSPHTFKIRYLHDNKDHPFLNRFKVCALKSLTVNYTPDGNYATFRDGKMVSYELSMQFQELDPIYNDDYGNAEQFPTEIGF